MTTSAPAAAAGRPPAPQGREAELRDRILAASERPLLGTGWAEAVSTLAV